MNVPVSCTPDCALHDSYGCVPRPLLLLYAQPLLFTTPVFVKDTSDVLNHRCSYWDVEAVDWSHRGMLVREAYQCLDNMMEQTFPN